MRTRAVAKYLRKYIAPHLDGFEVYGRLLYKRPPTPFISGFYFDEPSYNPRKLFTWAFVQPMFVPAEYIQFSFGNLIGKISGGGRKSWVIEDGSEEDTFEEILGKIHQEGLPYLGSRDTPRTFIDFYRYKAVPPHVIVMEAFAYSLLLEGLDDEAAAKLTEMMHIINEENIKKSPWLVDYRHRANIILNLLNTSHESAINQLGLWSNETLNNLGLEDGA
jgi:hypothetical protein